MTYSPTGDLQQRHPDVLVHPSDCSPARGAWIPDARVILIHRRLRGAAHRSALAHEVAHVDLEHTPTGHGWFDARQEREADGLAAERLVPLEALAEALVWALGPDEVADALEVETSVVRRRIRALSQDERDYIERRIAARQEEGEA